MCRPSHVYFNFNYKPIASTYCRCPPTVASLLPSLSSHRSWPPTIAVLLYIAVLLPSLASCCRCPSTVAGLLLLLSYCHCPTVAVLFLMISFFRSPTVMPRLSYENSRKRTVSLQFALTKYFCDRRSMRYRAFGNKLEHDRVRASRDL